MSGSPFDSARFRQVLGHFPTGVIIAATIHEDRPHGLAIGSFFSVSLEPPLVGFCADHRSSTWPRIRETGRFCASILAADQEDVCRVFASPADDKFAGVGWEHSPLGSPRIKDALAWIDCSVETWHTAGDHDIVVGRVADLEVARESDPLVFFRGGYRDLD